MPSNVYFFYILLYKQHWWAWQTTFWTWNCCCFIWNRFQLNNCEIQISLGKSDWHRGIKVTCTCLCITAVDINENCVIFILCCFLQFVFPFLPSVPSHMMGRSFTVLNILKWIQFCSYVTYELCYVQTSINHCYGRSWNLVCMIFTFVLWKCHISLLPSMNHLVVMSCKCWHYILSNWSYIFPQNLTRTTAVL
jgi:hypothetical protein